MCGENPLFGGSQEASEASWEGMFWFRHFWTEQLQAPTYSPLNDHFREGTGMMLFDVFLGGLFSSLGVARLQTCQKPIQNWHRLFGKLRLAPGTVKTGLAGHLAEENWPVLWHICVRKTRKF